MTSGPHTDKTDPNADGIPPPPPPPPRTQPTARSQHPVRLTYALSPAGGGLGVVSRCRPMGAARSLLYGLRCADSEPTRINSTPS